MILFPSNNSNAATFFLGEENSCLKLRTTTTTEKLVGLLNNFFTVCFEKVEINKKTWIHKFFWDISQLFCFSNAGYYFVFETRFWNDRKALFSDFFIGFYSIHQKCGGGRCGVWKISNGLERMSVVALDLCCCIDDWRCIYLIGHATHGVWKRNKLIKNEKVAKAEVGPRIFRTPQILIFLLKLDKVRYWDE